MPCSFFHKHPYPPYLPKGCEKLIIGTLPPPRLSTKELRKTDVDFCYGSCDNLLWPILGRLFNIDFLYNNSSHAVLQRKEFLTQHHLGICDIVDSCKRAKITAADLGIQEVILRDIFNNISIIPTLHTLIFTGGNSKNGPEYFFRQQAKENNITLQLTDNRLPRKHQFIWQHRTITTISLTSPSNAANRSIGANSHYKKRKSADPTYTSIDFRTEQYAKAFFT